MRLLRTLCVCALNKLEFQFHFQISISFSTIGIYDPKPTPNPITPPQFHFILIQMYRYGDTFFIIPKLQTFDFRRKMWYIFNIEKYTLFLYGVIHMNPGAVFAILIFLFIVYATMEDDDGDD